ncbi:response regulator, partial [Serratia grimesii]|uniref:response regulator n=1 Tax=Serratia grimesii TaxID=82995 RepID=UPI00223F4164
MSVLIALAALGLLMLAAYRGYSVILFAPIAALGAVLLTDPGAVAPTFTGLFMEKMVGFVKLYFPVFLLGAVFGKLIELSGFSRSIVAAAIRILGRRHAIPVIVLSARNAEEDKIAALDAGADDYLSKPFGIGELLARVRVALRRHSGSQQESPLISFSEITVDLVNRRV